jgi:hypothetical protein
MVAGKADRWALPRTLEPRTLELSNFDDFIPHMQHRGWKLLLLKVSIKCATHWTCRTLSTEPQWTGCNDSDPPFCLRLEILSRV